MLLHNSNLGGIGQPDLPLEIDPLVGHLSDEQLVTIRTIESGRNVFLTGAAGTGKSTLTSALVARHAGRKGVYVCGSTGISAFNLIERLLADLPKGLESPGVTTLHRWCGVGLGPQDGMSFETFYRDWFEHRPTKAKLGASIRVRNARCLIIDEVSMIPGRLLDYLDWHCRKLRDVDAPFGGIQIVAVGDFLQLPPVARDQNYDWAFKSRAWESLAIKPCVLKVIHRQADGPFTRLLNACRIGNLDAESVKVLAGCVRKFPSSKIIRMFTHNVQVDKWNNFQLAQIDKEPTKYWMGFNEFTSDDHKKTLTNNLLAPRCLELKIGARVMTVANISDNDGGMIACNGTMGRVIGLKEDAVLVETDDGRVITVKRQKWDLNPLEDESPAALQIPLRLSYAITIHKSQGLSLDAAVIDARAAREPGQTYVALSRLRTLNGLTLKEIIKGLVTSQHALKYMKSLEE
jgi:energy-coupling factor transporter ATP-binding protein EcfA2